MIRRFRVRIGIWAQYGVSNLNHCLSQFQIQGFELNIEFGGGSGLNIRFVSVWGGRGVVSDLY